MTDIKTVGKHTPGPWSYEYGNDTGPDDEYFREFYSVSTTGLIRRTVGDVCNEADARLICAAPDLLEALELVLDRTKWDEHCYLGPELEMRVSKAIDRARGEA